LIKHYGIIQKFQFVHKGMQEKKSKPTLPLWLISQKVMGVIVKIIT
jgi:hypothetical protein